jgi:hypothetical protein
MRSHTIKLTELERLALRCGTYGGIKREKLQSARRRAQRKLDHQLTIAEMEMKYYHFDA